MNAAMIDFLKAYGNGNDKYFPKPYHGCLYHYTSPEGLKSIIKESGHDICIWASRRDCFNDKGEGEIAIQIYKEVCKELLNKQEISIEVYDRIKNLQPQDTMLCVNDEIRVMEKRPYHQFIASFSKESDSLPMWNYYSKNHKYEGFAIGLSHRPYMSVMSGSTIPDNIRVEVVPVVYDDQVQKMMVASFIKDILDGDESDDISNSCAWIQFFLGRWSSVFKAHEFKHENEVRIIVDIPYSIRNGARCYEYPMKFRYSNGLLIPYVDLHIQKRMLESVIVGPINCDEKGKIEQATVLKDFLCSRGCWNSRTDYSKANVRF